MDKDDFERRLERLPWRQVHTDWRGEILNPTQIARRSDVRGRSGNAGPPWAHPLDGLKSLISASFWPSPKAWAGLAMTWLALLTINHFTTSTPATSALAGHRQAPEALMVRREEQRLLVELLGPVQAPATADRPKPSGPQPRSQLARNLLSA